MTKTITYCNNLKNYVKVDVDTLLFQLDVAQGVEYM